MAVKVRDFQGAWWIFIDHNGVRKAKRIGPGKVGKQAAERAKRELDARLVLGHPVLQAPRVRHSFADYSSVFLQRIEQSRKHTTFIDYRKMIDRDLLPHLHHLELTDITRDKVKILAMAALKKGQSPKTVQNIIRCLSSLLSHAVEDGLVPANVALKPGKFLPKVPRRHHITPLTRVEVSRLLGTTKSALPRYFPLLLCAVRTGLRMGELLALQWSDIDWHGRFIDVQRNYTRWKLTTPKSGESRRVDMSQELKQTLQDLYLERQVDAPVRGWQDIPRWVFCNEKGGHLHPNNLRDRVFYGLLRRAEIRKIRFHDLRHTFASLLIQHGESLAYVKEQMGHSSIQVTVDLYGHLIPGGNKQAVDRLDDTAVTSVDLRQSASNPQVTLWSRPVAPPPDPLHQVVTERLVGVSDGFRTRDLRIHNPAL